MEGGNEHAPNQCIQCKALSGSGLASFYLRVERPLPRCASLPVSSSFGAVFTPAAERMLLLLARDSWIDALGDQCSCFISVRVKVVVA